MLQFKEPLKSCRIRVPMALVIVFDLAALAVIGLAMVWGLREAWNSYQFSRELGERVSAEVSIFEVRPHATESKSTGPSNQPAPRIIVSRPRKGTTPDTACTQSDIICDESLIQQLAEQDHAVPDPADGAELSDGIANGTGQPSLAVDILPTYSCGVELLNGAGGDKAYGAVFRAGTAAVGYTLELKDIPNMENHDHVIFRVHATLRRLGFSRTIEDTVFVEAPPLVSTCSLSLLAAGNSLEPGHYRLDVEIRGLPSVLAPEAAGLVANHAWSWLGARSDLSDEFEIMPE